MNPDALDINLFLSKYVNKISNEKILYTKKYVTTAGIELLVPANKLLYVCVKEVCRL
jgi:hypothetical protein